jgi:hypothetical protein
MGAEVTGFGEPSGNGTAESRFSVRAQIAFSIEELLRLRGPLSALAIAQHLVPDLQDLGEARVNGVLYSLPARFARDRAHPPLWSIASHRVADAQEAGPRTVADWEAKARHIAELEPDMRLDDLVPNLPRDRSLDHLALPMRARGGLARGGVHHVADLQGLLVSDLRDFRGVGPTLVEVILAALMEANEHFADLVDVDSGPVYHSGLRTVPSATHIHTRTTTPEQGSSPRQADPLLDDLVTLAQWFHTIGRSDQPVLGAEESELPPLIADALRSLQSACALDLLEPGRPTAADAVDAFITDFSERELSILAARTFGKPPLTLDEIGRQLGLTRERVRQIEQRCLLRLDAAWSEEPMLALLAAATRQRVGTVRPLTALLDEFPALGEPVACLGEPLWFVIDRVDDEFQIVDGWCVSGSLASARESTLDVLEAIADDYGLLPLSAASSELGLPMEQDPAESGVKRWLAECGLPIMGDHVLTKYRSLPDRAVAALALEGKPMTAEEIHERLGADRSVGSLRNAMGADPRISRVGLGVWALKDWGLDEYTGIRELIRTELEKAGGRVDCDLLVSTLARQFGVAENSVRTYASSSPFELRDGYVQLARVDAESRRRRRPAKRLFFNDGWCRLRVTVTSEHLRGSGFPVQYGVADAIGLARGDRLDIPSRLGTQAVTWVGPQPTIGTIRRFLMDLGSCPGDEVFLVFGGGRFDVEPMAVVPNGHITRQALALAGLPEECPDPLPALSIAVGLPADSSKVSLIDSLIDRGDEDLAELLTHIPDSNGSAGGGQRVDIDTLMDLIG